MDCCTRYCAAETQFGNARAEGDLESYRQRGADRITRIMLTELRRWPLRGKKLLDVGGGIGVVGWELADSDLAGTTLVEASPAFLDAARREAEDRNASRPMHFVQGDFALIADNVADADVVTLNRVICCYPNAEALLRAAAAHARQLLVYTYPRDRWYFRAFTALDNWMRKRKGNAFRSFVHSPKRMASVLESSGFVRDSTRGTFVWIVDVYRRKRLAER